MVLTEFFPEVLIHIFLDLYLSRANSNNYGFLQQLLHTCLGSYTHQELIPLHISYIQQLFYKCLGSFQIQKYTYLFLPFVQAYSCLIPIRNKFKCVCVYYNSSFTHLLGLIPIRDKFKGIYMYFYSSFINLLVLTLISNITMCIWLPLNSFSVHLSGLRLIRNLRNAHGHLLAIHFVHLLGIKLSRNKFQLLVIFSDKVNGVGVAEQKCWPPWSADDEKF